MKIYLFFYLTEKDFEYLYKFWQQRICFCKVHWFSKCSRLLAITVLYLWCRLCWKSHVHAWIPAPPFFYLIFFLLESGWSRDEIKKNYIEVCSEIYFLVCGFDNKYIKYMAFFVCFQFVNKKKKTVQSF